MDVQYPVFKSIDEQGSENPHETGKADELGARFPYYLDQFPLKILPCSEYFMVHESGGNIVALRPDEAEGVALVADHEGNFTGDRFIFTRFYDRLKVRSPARNQYDDFMLFYPIRKGPPLSFSSWQPF